MSDSYLLNPYEQDRRQKSRVLMIIRGVFLVTLVTATMLALLRELPEESRDREAINWFVDFWWIALAVAVSLGIAAVLMDTLAPRKKLSGMTAIVFGLIAGLLATVLLSWVFELLVQSHDISIPTDGPANRIILAIKAAFAITLCYLGVSVVYSTQDEFRLIIPYVEFSKQMRGTRPLVLDTSAIIDGRFNDMAQTGFITAPVIVPKFIIDELQSLSDSSDRLKRSRGRRGLDIVRKMQNNPHLDVNVSESSVRVMAVDQMLVEFARENAAQLVTTDFNLNKVASIHGVQVLNINDLANALKPVAIPGETMAVEIVKRGEGAGQGVGYLDDGTMVVIEEAADRIGGTVQFTVTSAIQTSAGRMIFGESSAGAGSSTAKREQDGARHESPRAPERMSRDGDAHKAVANGGGDGEIGKSDTETESPARAAAGATPDHGSKIPSWKTPPKSAGPSRRNPRRG